MSYTVILFIKRFNCKISNVNSISLSQHELIFFVTTLSLKQIVTRYSYIPPGWLVNILFGEYPTPLDPSSVSWIKSPSTIHFVWAWLTCILGRPPQVIVTDRFRILQIVVADVFPQATHCLVLAYRMSCEIFQKNWEHI